MGRLRQKIAPTDRRKRLRGHLQSSLALVGYTAAAALRVRVAVLRPLAAERRALRLAA
jgi:hypothetical protein